MGFGGSVLVDQAGTGRLEQVADGGTDAQLLPRGDHFSEVTRTHARRFNVQRQLG